MSVGPRAFACLFRRRQHPSACPTPVPCGPAAPCCTAADFPASECTGPVQQATATQVVGNPSEVRVGFWLNEPNGQHRFRIRQWGSALAGFNFIDRASLSHPDGLIGCLSPQFPDRVYSNNGSIFVFAGNFCFHPSQNRAMRGCPTATGWLFWVDSSGTGKYDMVVEYIR